MFDIGFLELALIAVLALVVLGPERLPGAARSVGKFTARARSLARGLQAQFRAEIEREENRLRDGLGAKSEPEDSPPKDKQKPAP